MKAQLMGPFETNPFSLPRRKRLGYAKVIQIGALPVGSHLFDNIGEPNYSHL
jgi:hypothetical protein